MSTDSGLIFAVVAGFWEPVWVWFLTRAEHSEGRARNINLVMFVITSVLSIYFLSFAMRTMNVGVAYAVWTAVGSLITLAIGRLFLSEALNPRKILAVFMILTGIIGLEVFA